MDNNWKLVPVEPTEEMIIAFAETWFSRKRCIDDCEMEDCYRAMIAAAPTPDNNGWIPTHRHIKTGGLYQVIGAGKLQTDEPLSDNCHMILYRGEDGRLWARSNYEFEDTDRFEPLPPPPALDKGE